MFLRSIPALLLLLGQACHAAEPLPAPLAPDQEARALALAEANGRAIYVHDRAAAIVSDALMRLPASERDPRLTGWVTENNGSDIVVTFVAFPKEGPKLALYRAVVDAQGRLLGSLDALKPGLPLSEFEQGAATARATASASGFKPCSAKYNSVVLPVGEGANRSWAVYLLPGTTEKFTVPLGGAHRVQTDWSGHTIQASRAFSKSCINLKSDEVATAGLMVTHLMDPTPTEFHVFSSQWARLPLFVATAPGGRLWKIEQGKITEQKLPAP